MRQLRTTSGTGDGCRLAGEFEHGLQLCRRHLCEPRWGIQPLFGQVGQQGGLERVASAYAVAHRHWLRSDSELAVLPAEQLRAIATPGDHHQLGVVAQPALGNAMWFDARVKQAQILVTDLDQMGLLGEGLDPLAPAGKIRLDVEPHVRVEGNQALCLFTAQQFQQRLGDGRGHQRVGTEVDARTLSGSGRNCSGCSRRSAQPSPRKL